MKEKISVDLLDFLHCHYPAIRDWIHRNDEAQEGRSDSRFMEFGFNHEVSPQHLDFLYSHFPTIRAWVRKNDELRDALQGGKYCPRLMQVGYEDFVLLESYL